MNASDVERFLAESSRHGPVEHVRSDLALELLDDVRRIDAQLKASHRRIRLAVAPRATRVTELYGVGPILAARS